MARDISQRNSARRYHAVKPACACVGHQNFHFEVVRFGCPEGLDARALPSCSQSVSWYLVAEAPQHK